MGLQGEGREDLSLALYYLGHLVYTKKCSRKWQSARIGGWAVNRGFARVPT